MTTPLMPPRGDKSTANFESLGEANRAKIRYGVNRLTRDQILVGVPSSSGEHSGGINNATLAYIHNYGSPAANIPQRQFMEPTLRQMRPVIEKWLRYMGRLAIHGQVERIPTVEMQLGQLIVDAIKRKITDGPFAPLAQSTVRARERRGQDVSNLHPLIDSGQLRRSINFVIRTTEQK